VPSKNPVKPWGYRQRLPSDQAENPASDLFLRTLQPVFASSRARSKGTIFALWIN
jgi:hypothetical protein